MTKRGGDVDLWQRADNKTQSSLTIGFTRGAIFGAFKSQCSAAASGRRGVEEDVSSNWSRGTTEKARDLSIISNSNYGATLDKNKRGREKSEFVDFFLAHNFYPTARPSRLLLICHMIFKEFLLMERSNDNTLIFQGRSIKAIEYMRKWMLRNDRRLWEMTS